MKIGINILILIFLGTLMASVQAETKYHPMDMTQAIENAKTPADHEALAQHYEEVAKEMKSEVERHEKLLDKYETNRHLYGRLGVYLRDHSNYLIHLYTEAEKTNKEMAESHRKIAAEMK